MTIARGGKPVRGIQPERISSVEEKVMYWRKANHIHAWFVKNVQDGQDDCREYYVACEQVRDLLRVCTKVIDASKLIEGSIYGGTAYTKDHPDGVERRLPGKVIEDPSVAKRLLPTQDGFFFGSTEYDQHYLEDVVATRDWAARMVDDCERGVPGDIYYQSSW
ncbi:hypothetical protein J2S73_002873 [Amorphus orientalis]|uniref:Uncharacterized protein n=1 Tax=Amorphus orientalis TaxID=649198 RepID=A0AAE3VRL8_9HYPH|nr:hypothetical protein [Amorphus orientalis]